MSQAAVLLNPTKLDDDEGPGVGAFFDLDGTLVAGYTAAAQMRHRLLRRDLRVVEFLMYLVGHPRPTNPEPACSVS